MTASVAETQLLRQQTVDFIAADPREIVLMREERVPNGSGGFISTRSPLPSQTLRLIPLDQVGEITERQLPDGVIVKPVWVLMGSHQADMENGDRFEMSPGLVGEIVYVQEKRLYQVKGEVVFYGITS